MKAFFRATDLVAKTGENWQHVIWDTLEPLIARMVMVSLKIKG